jgi:hypothetical protein
MGSCIRGITVKRNLENSRHKIITIEKPVKIPRLNGIALLKPTLAALLMDIMLLGPGVKAIMRIYGRNDAHGNMINFYSIL